MKNKEYKKLVNSLSPKEHRFQNFLVAFFVGGLIGLFGEFFIYVLQSCFSLFKEDAGCYLTLTLIGGASLFTALNFFDNWVLKCKCGLIIPTTGFAHSVISSALDYKKDGLITGLGSNFFKLAGSVILYGVIGAFILVIGRVIIGG